MVAAVTADWAPDLVGWLLTYTVHSTVILTFAWLLCRRGPLSRPPVAAELWRAAALAGVLTATVQISWQNGAASAQSGTEMVATIERTVRRPPPDGLQDRRVRLRRAVVTEAPTACREARPPPMGLEARIGVRPVTAPLAVPLAADGLSGCRLASQASWPLWILGLWLGGAAVAGIRLGLCHRAFLRSLNPRCPPAASTRALLVALRRTADIRRSVTVEESSGLVSPVALGRRRIVLPAHATAWMNRGELRAVLAHELAHVQRADPFWLGVVRTVEALFFFQPLNRLARRRFQEAAEFTADAWAVEWTDEPLDLARSLEKVASRAHARSEPVTSPAVALRESPVVERVRRLVAGETGRGGARLGRLASATLLPALLLPPVQIPSPRVLRVVVIEEVRTFTLPEGGLPADPLPDERAAAPGRPAQASGP